MPCLAMQNALNGNLGNEKQKFALPDCVCVVGEGVVDSDEGDISDDLRSSLTQFSSCWHLMILILLLACFRLSPIANFLLLLIPRF